MAISDSHRLGQSIGLLLEDFIDPILRNNIPNQFFLDSVRVYRPATKSTKVCWYDSFGNKHDLDYVIESGGSLETIGNPQAFIECAWRRYTKHSKNKAQEIQGAVLPLAEKYRNNHPFLGAILAGEFTAPSIQQLNSVGFSTLYIEYNEIVQAYSRINLDIAFDEKTSLTDLRYKADQAESLSNKDKEVVLRELYKITRSKVDSFMQNLLNSLSRKIKNIIVQPLYGYRECFNDASSAIKYMQSLNLNDPKDLDFNSIFIYVEYNNGSNFRAEFMTQLECLNFLSTL